MAGYNMNMALLNGLNLDQIMMLNRNGVGLSQEQRLIESCAASPGCMNEDGEATGQTRTTTPLTLALLDHDEEPDQRISLEAANSKEFEKELFLEELRKYRCLWDINSDGYKSRPMKQNAWSKLSQLFNKDGEDHQRVSTFHLGRDFNKSLDEILHTML